MVSLAESESLPHADNVSAAASAAAISALVRKTFIFISLVCVAVWGKPKLGYLSLQVENIQHLVGKKRGH
jgi:ABC-type transport system involved in cytochrome c biogenesis permease subunit